MRSLYSRVSNSMKLACSTTFFLVKTVEESIQIIKDTGYEGVVILCDIPHAYPSTLDDEKISSIVKAASDARISISGLNAFSMRAIGGDVFSPSWIESDEKKKKLRIDYTKECIRLAKKLGTNMITTEPGGLISDASDFSQMEKDFVDGLNEVIPVAEQENVKVLLEPTPGCLIENSQQFLSFIQKINSDYIGLNFDIGHFFCVNEDPSQIIPDLSKYIGHFDIEDIAADRTHKHLLPGLGSIDFQSVLKSIKDIGYDGYVTVELHPYTANPQRAARMAYNYLNRVLEDMLT